MTNAGPANATGVTVTDTLPANTTFVSAMPSQGSFTVDTTAGVLTANLGTLRNGASATVQVVVQPTMTGTGTLTSTASIRSDQNDPNPQNNTAVQNTTVIPAAPADLAIAQVALPDPVALDGQLTDTIPVTNLGPGSATEVIVTDAVPSGVVFVSAKASQGTAGLAADGSVTANLGTLAPGQAALVTVVVQPTAIGTVTNTVSVQANQPDFNPANNRAISQTQVLTDVIPPTILAQRLIVSQQAITGIVLTFSQPMNPLLAASVNNYQILSGNGAGTPIPLISARYNAARQTVTLIPQRPLVLGQFYELTANGKGAPGLTDLAGNVLDGDQNGLPDGIFTTTIGRGTSRRPLRFQADQAIPHPAPAPPHHPRPHPAAPQPHVPRSPQGTAVSTLILSVQRQHSPGG